MKPTILVSDTLGQETTTRSFTIDRDSLPAAVFCSGLAGTEQAALQMLAGEDQSTGWFGVVQGGNAVLLTADDNVITIVQPGEYRLVISATAGAVVAGFY